ncbi:MAG: oxygen-independent coproporphyrinogen III oxidase [Deltaproteobacteria bacterium]|nr:oxygen-independent coproporphyrinogen III oxidase [Deltaproteobacteria bacterium]
MIKATIDGQAVTVSPQLIEKYSRPGPRYTSYPTAPNWSKNFGPEDFAAQLAKSNAAGRPLSLYFHIPFCDERCTFCACSVVATRRHEVAEPYLTALSGEIGRAASLVDSSRRVSQFHWGGGTPTYLSCEQIEKLWGAIARHFSFADNAEISIEIDPRVTSAEQLKTLRGLGFNRTSLGVQDFNPDVQREAGRIQSFEETKKAVDGCRELKFQSVNIDLVYGLPRQTPKSFEKTLEQVLELNPDRIALFNFAFVPWMHAHQRKISERDLPSGETKLEMFCGAIEVFQDAGFTFIGLDHFAKAGDELTRAQRDKTMYRNFQGYTTQADCDLIGMGVTAISSVDGSFAQNAKKLKDYEETDFEKTLATRAGLKLSTDDLLRQMVIRELFCHQQVQLENFFALFEKERPSLETLAQDGLVELETNGLRVTPLGRLFLRNIGMVFDAYLKPGEGKFSRTV